MTESIASGAEVLSGQGESAPDSAEATGNAAQESPWYGQLDEKASGFIQNKGWQNIEGMLTSYQNLEKAVGKERLAIPSGDDQEAWNDLYNKLGRPENADLYKLEVPEGVESDDQLLSWFKGTAHKYGLSQDQASSIFREWNEMTGGISQETEDQRAAQSESDMADLRKEWGLAYDAHVQAAKRTAERYGFTQDELNGIESAIGTKGLMQKFAAIGKSMGEDSFEHSGKDSGFGMTPSQAQDKIASLKSDPQFIKSYQDPSAVGHKEAVQQMTRLMQSAYPE